MSGRILTLGKVFQFSNGFLIELWMFLKVRKLILNAIVANILILSQIILRKSNKKNAMEIKVPI